MLWINKMSFLQKLIRIQYLFIYLLQIYGFPLFNISVTVQ